MSAKFRAEKDPPRAGATEALPDGWLVVPLQRVAAPSKERIEPQRAGDAPYVGLEHIQAQTTRLIGHGQAQDVQSTKSVFRRGDVLYGKLRPYLGKTCVAPFDGVASTDILVFPRTPWVDSRYLMWFLSQSSTVEFASQHAAGTQLPRVSFQALGELPFPLPPTAEQHRIADLVERLLGKLASSQGRLQRLLTLLERFRLAVLAAAVSGRLTEDWRENMSGGPIAQGRGLKESGVPAGAPADIPPSWQWVRAGVAYTDARYGTSIKCYPDATAGMPVLRVPNIARGRLDLANLKYAEGKQELKDLVVQEGDLLVCRTNGSMDLIGKAAIVPHLEEPHAFASYLIRLRLNPRILDPKYLHALLSSPIGRAQIVNRARTTAGQFNLNLEILRGLTVPVPPLEEQTEIIHRIDMMLSLADTIERGVARARARTGALGQRILAKAFRGELVPTEAELAEMEGRRYESAGQLLDRIRKSNDYEGEGTGRPHSTRRKGSRPRQQ